MKRTTTERSDSTAAYEAPVQRGRTNTFPATGLQATTPQPSMAEKRNLLTALGSGKEIAAGEFGGPLGAICFHWPLPLEVTTKIASMLKLPSEWKGLMLSGRQGYCSVDTAHPERRVPGLKADLASLCPSSRKASADDIRRFLDKLATHGAYDRALLTELSFEARLASQLAVLFWAGSKVYEKERPTARKLIIENLEALRKSRGEKNFEDDVLGVLPLLRPDGRKVIASKYQTEFKATDLRMLSEKRVVTMSAAFLLEIQKASLRYRRNSFNANLPLQDMVFWEKALDSCTMTDLTTLAAIGDKSAEFALVQRLTALPVEKRRESINEVHCAIRDAIAQGHLSLRAPNQTYAQIDTLLWDCIRLMGEVRPDNDLLRASVKIISATYRYTEKLWIAAPGRKNEKFSDHLLEQTYLSSAIGQWIETLPHQEAMLVRAELPAFFFGTHGGELN